MRLNPFRKRPPRLTEPEAVFVRSDGSIERRPLGRSAVEKATLGDIQAARGLGSVSSDSRDWARTVYAEQMFKSVPAYRAITLRANAVKSAPIVVMRRDSNGDPQPVGPAHPAQQLLTRVNRWWTSADLLGATETHLSAWGSSFWFLDRGESAQGPPRGIWPLRPDRVKIIAGRPKNGMPFAEDDYIAGFEYSTGTHRIPLRPDEVVWFRYFNPLDEYGGLAPTAPALQTLTMGRDAVTFNANFFKNGAMPGDIVFVVEHSLDDDQVAEFYQRLEARFKGATNAHRPMIWDGTSGKPERLGISQKDMEFIQSLGFTDHAAAQTWGVPMVLMMSEQASTFANQKEGRISFYTGTVAPEWRFIESEITEGLLPLFGDGLIARFDTSNILPLREAQAELDKDDREAVQQGLMTIDEYREKRGMAPVPWGSVWWAPSTVVPVSGPEAVVSEAAGGAVVGQGYKVWDDAALDAVSKAFEDRHEAGARTFKRFQRDIFERQRRDVLRRLNNMAPQGLGSPTNETRADPGKSPLFDPKDWRIDRAEAERLVTSMLFVEGEAHAEEFNAAFDRDEVPDDWLRERADWWSRRTNVETGRALMAELAEAISLDEGIPEMQARVNKVFTFNDFVRSERIARTEMLAAANKGHLEVYRQSEGVFAEKMWLCVDGDTKVSGVGITHIARRWHRGPMVELTTAQGRVVTVTTDHRVLTGRGWVAAKDIHEGDDIISYEGGIEGAAPSSRGMPNVDHVPPTIAQVFDALYEPAASAGMVTRIVNLDGKGRDSHIDVISANSELLSGLKPSGSESICQFLLELSDVELGNLFASSASLHGTDIHDALRVRETSGGDAFRLSGRRFFASPDESSLGLRSDRFARNTQALSDARTGTVPSLAESPNRIALPVLFGYDRCVSVKIVSSGRHVYDYSTETGWMIANSLVVHNSTLDDRTRPIRPGMRFNHFDAHRQVVPLESSFLVSGEQLEAPGIGGSPGNVINCILPGNEVEAYGIIAGSRAFYSGRALEFTTESGRKLTVTPNHPILTPNGFQPAQSLTPGDDVISSRLAQRVHPVDQDVTNVPTRIEQIFGALSVLHASRSRHVTMKDDFHGDGEFVDGDVDVVWADGKLWCTCHAVNGQQLHQVELNRGGFGQCALFGLGLEAVQISVPRAVATPRVRVEDETLPLVGAGVGHSGEHGGASITRLDAIVDQPSPNQGAAHAPSFGQGLLRNARFIQTDQLVNVREFDFSGHVYDLQTLQALYTASGIIAHNCRCTVAPVVKRQRSIAPPAGQVALPSQNGHRP